MSERSEFGLRAASGEARREPARLHAADRVRRRDLLVSFGSRQKKLARLRAKALHLPFLPLVAGEEAGSRSSPGLPHAPRAASFCLVKRKHDSAYALANGEAGPKGERRRRESNRQRRTRSDAIQPHRFPALLGRRGTQPKLAALRHGLLYDPAALRCSARFTAGTPRSKAESRSRSRSRSGSER